MSVSALRDLPFSIFWGLSTWVGPSICAHTGVARKNAVKKTKTEQTRGGGADATGSHARNLNLALTPTAWIVSPGSATGPCEDSTTARLQSKPHLTRPVSAPVLRFDRWLSERKSNGKFWPHRYPSRNSRTLCRFTVPR